MTEPYLYYLFRDGLFVGKYLFSEWQKLRADEIFNSHVYSNRNKRWYYSNWGSLIPLNDCDLPKEIQLLLMLTPIDSL